MRRQGLSIIVLLSIVMGAGSAFYLIRRYNVTSTSILPGIHIGPLHISRPYGMAPVAFDAFVRACYRAGINPDRITQTIGDHPLSVGYHKRDGTISVRGVQYDYTAATDIHVFPLTDEQIERLLQELAKQGFACWYRHGGKWTGGEHIHAVYALLPMKRQLRGQVQQFLEERREAGLQPLKWEVKLRRLRRRLARRA